MCDRIAIVYRGTDRRPGHHGRAPAADRVGRHGPGGPLPQAHRRTRGSISSTPSSKREPGERRPPEFSRASGPSSRPSGGACWSACGMSARPRGPSSCCWSSSAPASGRRSSASPSGYCATSGTWRTSATCSPPRCSAIILLAFLSILLLSNIITALSTFFLAKDLDLLVGGPDRLAPLLPGQARRDGGALLVDGGAARRSDPHGLRHRVSRRAALPLRRARRVRPVPPSSRPWAGRSSQCCWSTSSPRAARASCWASSASAALGLLVLLLRLIRPEQLARPEGFRNFVDYLAVLRTPTSPCLPSEWAAEMIMNWLLRVGDPLPIADAVGRRRCGALALGALVHRAALPARASRRRRRAPSGSRRQAARPVAAAAREGCRRPSGSSSSRTCGSSSATTPSGASSSCWRCC